MEAICATLNSKTAVCDAKVYVDEADDEQRPLER